MEYLPLPKLGGNSEAEQLKELQRYIFQVVQQLNFILSDIDIRLKGENK